MRSALVFILCLFAYCCFAQSDEHLLSGSVEQVATLDDMMAYTGHGNTLIVTDAKRGGIFTYAKIKGRVVIDSGIVFPANNKGIWTRVYDVGQPVHLSWFPAYMDSVTNDARALKAALAYPAVKIDGCIALRGGFNFPAGKIIEVATGAYINILDSVAIKFESTLKNATDYQDIFGGSGHVLFGSRSVPYVSVCWFGARADCPGTQIGKGADNTQAIQNAINAAERVSEVFLPPCQGNFFYRITSTLTISKKNNFFSFNFHGKGTSIGFTANDRSTTIFADMKEGAALNIQGSRRVYIHDMAFIGLNKAPGNLGLWKRNTSATDTVEDPANFLSPGLKTSYAAITTDADPKSKVWSADVVFQDLQIYNFCLGIGISQAGHLAGDRMRVERCQINYCTYGLSVGNAQNRGCHFTNVDMDRVWCALTNTVYGDHSGSMFMVTGGQWCHVYKMFIIQPCYLGQCSINGLYTEAAGCIGTLGHNNDNTGAIIFNGCNLSMRDEALHTTTMYLPPFYTATVCGNVTFDGCNFYMPRLTLNMMVEPHRDINGAAITMRGCTVLKADQIFINGPSHIENTYFSPYADGIDFNNTVSGVADGQPHRYNTWFNAVAFQPVMETAEGSKELVQANLKISRVIPRFYKVQDTKGLISDIVLLRDTLTFTYDASLQPSFFRYIMVGDLLGSTVKDIPSTGADNLALRILTIDTNTGSVTVLTSSNKVTLEKLALYTNCFILTQPAYGTVSSGNNIVTGVNNSRLFGIGDFITFKGATKVYRISKVDTAKGELALMTPVQEAINGRVEIYNQVLTPYTDTSIANAAIRSVSSDVLLETTDHTVIANSLERDVHVDLPEKPQTGHTFYIKKTAAAHNVSIVARNNTIDGKQGITLKDNYQSVQLLFDGEKYITIK